jgi:molybdopterin adenylyltransferase
VRTAILTVSTSVASRLTDDLSGPALAGLAEEAGCEIVGMEVVPDDFALIEDRLHHFVDQDCDLIFTTGGTGMTPDDITPEATRVLIHREAPGLAEAMRLVSPLGRLSRAMAGTVGQALVLNTPGSSKGAVETLDAVIDVVPHALDLLSGGRPH